MKVFIANFGLENYEWPECERRGTVATMNAVPAFELWRAGDGESFFVRHAYFPGARVPYDRLRATLKGEVDEEAWESLKRTVSRPFLRPASGWIAVKVINHLGDKVMKAFRVQA